MEERTARRSVSGDDPRFWRNLRRMARKETCIVGVRRIREEGVEEVRVRSRVNMSCTTTRRESRMWVWSDRSPFVACLFAAVKIVVISLVAPTIVSSNVNHICSASFNVDTGVFPLLLVIVVDLPTVSRENVSHKSAPTNAYRPTSPTR